MAEDKPYFNAEMQKKAIEWIDQKCTADFKCECCQASQWTLNTEIVVPPVYRKGMMIGGAVTPSFLLVCTNCGNSKFFNAVVSRILPAEAKQAEKKEGEDGKNPSQ